MRPYFFPAGVLVLSGAVAVWTGTPRGAKPLVETAPLATPQVSAVELGGAEAAPEAAWERLLAGRSGFAPGREAEVELLTRPQPAPSDREPGTERAEVSAPEIMALPAVAGEAALEEDVVGHAAEPAAELRAEDFEMLSRRHQNMVLGLISGAEEARVSGRAGIQPEVCFAGGTRPEVMRAFSAASRRVRQAGGFSTAALQLGGRWSRTATNPSLLGLKQGDPITLTWSILPDGVSIPGDGAGEATSPSRLRQRLNALYGSEAVWLPIISQMFERWGQLVGVKYIYEPNDDGAVFPNTPGALGVRGDVRIGGHPIDGNSNVLAYNYFPDSGDMVIDTDDNFFNDVSGNSRRLRAVLSHEHGHGLGLKHVCPVNSTKLMEPYISHTISDPQQDDVYSGQRHYGDRLEHNDTASTATALGTLASGQHFVDDVGLDADGDVDFYRFGVSGGSLALSVTARPVGSSYLEGGQNADGSCSSGVTYNSAAVLDLRLEVRNSNGSTVLASANANGVGAAETISGLQLPAGGGPFFVRVSAVNKTNNNQLYRLEMALAEMAPPSPPTLAVADVSAGEGAGTVSVVVTATPPPQQAVSVKFRAEAGTAAAGEDFVGATGTLNFPAGADRASAVITLNDDALDEDDEQFAVILSEPAGATLGRSSAVVTILDNDEPPLLRLDPVQVAEAGGTAAFVATLSAPSGRRITAQWRTRPGSAEEGADYRAAAGTLTLEPGSRSAPLPVGVIDDALPETDEEFSVELSEVAHASVPAPAATGRILDDEALDSLAHTGGFSQPDAQGRPVVGWQAVPGRRYRIECSLDLQTWVELAGDATVLADREDMSFTDTTERPARCFYRVTDVTTP